MDGRPGGRYRWGGCDYIVSGVFTHPRPGSGMGCFEPVPEISVNYSGCGLELRVGSSELGSNHGFQS